METVSQLRFAQKRGYISREQLIPVYKHAEQIARMLSGLRDSLPIED